ncbi:MAG: hypothetical protein AAF412_03095, partial [Pseudomonadota bacterium]
PLKTAWAGSGDNRDAVGDIAHCRQKSRSGISGHGLAVLYDVANVYLPNRPVFVNRLEGVSAN